MVPTFARFGCRRCLTRHSGDGLRPRLNSALTTHCRPALSVQSLFRRPRWRPHCHHAVYHAIHLPTVTAVPGNCQTPPTGRGSNVPGQFARHQLSYCGPSQASNPRAVVRTPAGVPFRCQIPAACAAEPGSYVPSACIRRLTMLWTFA